jgi:hypothetical protein
VISDGRLALLREASAFGRASAAEADSLGVAWTCRLPLRLLRCGRDNKQLAACCLVVVVVYLLWCWTTYDVGRLVASVIATKRYKRYDIITLPLMEEIVRSCLALLFTCSSHTCGGTG